MGVHASFVPVPSCGSVCVRPRGSDDDRGSLGLSKTRVPRQLFLWPLPRQGRRSRSPRPYNELDTLTAFAPRLWDSRATPVGDGLLWLLRQDLTNLVSDLARLSLKPANHFENRFVDGRNDFDARGRNKLMVVSGEVVMENVCRYRAIASLYRQTAAGAV
jgi:hypothetical protein